MEGWISLHRSIMKHWISDNSNFFKWFIFMLMEVNHSDRKMPLGYSVITIKRGQSSRSLRSWAAVFNTNTKAVTKFFNMLESDGIITREILGKGKHSTTLINIVHYNQYQSNNETQKTTQKTTQDTTESKHKRDTNNNVNNENNFNNSNNLDSLPQNFKEWSIDDFKKNIIDNKNKECSNDELKDFLFYWSEENEKGKMRFQLEKTWSTSGRLRTWIKRSKQFKKQTDKPEEKISVYKHMAEELKKELYG